MNGETYESLVDYDAMTEAINSPEVVEAYPMDFTGSVYDEGMTPASWVTDWVNQSDQPSPKVATGDLTSFFGKALDIVGKTYQQINQAKYFQNFKSVPSVQSGLNKLGYPTVRAAQTGIDTGIPTITKGVNIAGLNVPFVLIVAVGGLLLFMVIKK